MADMVFEIEGENSRMLGVYNIEWSTSTKGLALLTHSLIPGGGSGVAPGPSSSSIFNSVTGRAIPNLMKSF